MEKERARNVSMGEKHLPIKLGNNVELSLPSKSKSIIRNNPLEPRVGVAVAAETAALNW